VPLATPFRNEEANCRLSGARRQLKRNVGLIESFRRVLPEHFLLWAAKISVAPVPLKLKEQFLWGFRWRSRTARDESRSTFHLAPALA